ncbi:MAG: 50S ribosomal protein L25/general stress protein Ctc [Kineosporiaceae bacterium]
MSEVKLTAEKRTEFGKGAARRLRRAHMVPAVLYGHGTDPVHLALPGHATMLALKHSNTLLTLDVGGSTQLALPKDIQRHAIKGLIEHVDLLLVRRGEKVTVDVPLHVVGESASGTLVTSELNTLEVEVEATNIPSSIEVSVEGLAAGARILAGEIVLPAGTTLITDADALALQVTSPTEELPAEEAGAEAEAEPAKDAAEE